MVLRPFLLSTVWIVVGSCARSNHLVRIHNLMPWVLVACNGVTCEKCARTSASVKGQDPNLKENSELRSDDTTLPTDELTEYVLSIIFYTYGLVSGNIKYHTRKIVYQPKCNTSFTSGTAVACVFALGIVTCSR